MNGLGRKPLRERFFRVSVLLKGLNALLEIVGGVTLLGVSPAFILRTVALLTQDELAEDPRDFIANYFLHAASHLSLSGQRFAAIYLLGHGVIKIGLVWALLKHKLWAYPLSIIVFGAFIVYQLYRFTLTHGLGLIALSLFDLVVIWLIYLEYRALKQGMVGLSRIWPNGRE
jgi:uncharacterized membrane protein